MGKAERNRRQSAREKIAAQQAAARRAQVRKQVLLTVGSVAAVLAVVVAFVVIKAFGAEYCPYCGTERWAMAEALSRFGTFSGLRFIHSSASDVYPSTPTLTFYKATYTSKYVTFTPVEETTVSKQPLQTPTAAQEALVTKYDVPPNTTENGSIPFVDFGNKFMLSGDQYNPQLLQGKTWAQVAAALQDPSNPIAQGADGAANTFAAAICKLTNNMPATACTPTVQAIEGTI
jgi:hypothetical protein